MTFERTRDAEVIRGIVTHPQIYPHVSDDGCPAAADWEPCLDERIWYVLVRDGAEVLGLWMFVPQNFITAEIHTCLLPAAWGPRTRTAARELAAWAWANMPFRRIVTNVPDYNRVALRFAEMAGMTRFGVNEHSFQKGGRIYDQVMLGLSKPEGE